MTTKLDYSILDDPDALQFVFYPRHGWTSPPAGASDHMVPVEANISVFVRFYLTQSDRPSILFFHGNGEIACDYDWIAPLYHRVGVNLFVADYRGYGKSGGRPTFSSMVADAYRVFEYCKEFLSSHGYDRQLFLMGRSLGSVSALELASAYAPEVKGLILESGFVSFVRLLERLGGTIHIPNLKYLEEARTSIIRSIETPVLIIHGEEDELIPHSEAVRCYETLGSRDKTLLTIAGAGHNDILLVGVEQYFDAISAFIRRLIVSTEHEVDII